MKSEVNLSSLFVWREIDSIDDKRIQGLFKYWWSDKPEVENRCLYCKTTLFFYSPQYHVQFKLCPVCGWKGELTEVESGGIVGTSFTFLRSYILKQFDINSKELLISEIATHLKKHHSDLQSLSWRQFERLINDVLKQHGYRCILTQQSKDGGADVLIIDDGNKIIGIVECKKYSNSQKIGIEFIRCLVGAAVDFDVKEAWLFTTSSFTQGATQISRNYKEKGFNINLVAASEILNYLNIYNTELPFLEKLDKDFLSELERENLINIKRALDQS